MTFFSFGGLSDWQAHQKKKLPPLSPSILFPNNNRFDIGDFR